MKKILDILDINDLNSMDTTFASDLKVCKRFGCFTFIKYFFKCLLHKLSNILAGIGNHASAFGCLYCHQKTSGVGAYEDNGEPVFIRTVGSLKKGNLDFMEIGQGKKSNAKNFFSCIHPPILKGEDTMEVIELIPPPGTYF